MGAGNHLGRDEFSEAAHGLRACIEWGLHGSDISFDDDRNVGGSDLFFADELDVGAFEPPRMILYADDFVVFHDHRQVIEAARIFIEDWLRSFGLNLSLSKTRIAHTLEKVDGLQAGFDFLGCRVQQFPVGKHVRSPHFKGNWTDIRPSRKTVKQLLEKCDEVINKYGPRKKRNAAYQLQQEKGQAGPIEVMVIKLNSSIRGWCNYHRYGNAKKTFSRIDHELYKILWAWAKRTFPRRGHRSLVQELWLSKGRPWRFRAPSSSTEKEPLELYAAASTPIEKYIPVKAIRSYYDGDWAYWGKRPGVYPGIPKKITALLKWQNGKCAVCRGTVAHTDRVMTTRSDTKGGNILLHHRCDVRNSNDRVQDGSDCPLSIH